MKINIIVVLIFFSLSFLFSEDLNKDDNLDRDLLYACSQYPVDNDLIVDLIKRGADVNATTRGGFSAVMRASEKNNLDTIKLLVEYGADINIPNKAGFTPLMRAIVRGHLSVVVYLLDNGADYNAVTKSGLSTIDVAVNYKRDQIIELINEAKKIEKDIKILE